MRHKTEQRKPLGDMTNGSRHADTARPKRDKKPSTRILFLKGLDTSTTDTTAHKENRTKQNDTITTSTPVKPSRRPVRGSKNKAATPAVERDAEDNAPKSRTNTRSKAAIEAVPEVKKSPAKKRTQPIKKAIKPSKPTALNKTDSSANAEKQLPSKSVKFQCDDADTTEPESSGRKKTRPNKSKEPEKVNDSPTKSVNVSAVDKPAKIPIYRRIKALNAPSPVVAEAEKLYEFDFDPKVEPAKPIKKKNTIKKSKTAAPKRKKKNLDLNQSEDMAKLIKELKKIRAATQAKKKKALLPPPPLPPPVRITVSPTSSNADNLSGQASNETSHHTMEIDDLGSSIFNEAPIANSSMIRPFQSPRGSTRTPASPWRVQCNEVNKWPRNIYVKPSMTPAYDRDTSHAFNLDNPPVRADCSSATDRGEKDPIDPKDYTLYKADVSDWRQTSILSYYEKAMNKSPRKRGRSPKKPVKPLEPEPNEDPLDLPPEVLVDLTAAPEMTAENFLDLPPEVMVDLTEAPEMTAENPPEPVVENFFGFDESPELDQENVSPKKLSKIKSVKEVLVRTRKQFGNILKEVNQKNNAPMRVSPKKVMTLRNAQKKQAEKEVSTNLFTNCEPVECIEPNEENDSVSNETAQTSAEIRLFENPTDVEAMSFNKTHRRSYERKRKPVVKYKSAIEIIPSHDVLDGESDSDESVQLTIKKKATKRKPNAPSKKEEKEANEWAAEFNSLLEEADDFDLCVE